MRTVDVQTAAGDPARLAAVVAWLDAEGVGGRAVWRVTVVTDPDAKDDKGKSLTGTVVADEWVDGESVSFTVTPKTAPPWTGWEKQPPKFDQASLPTFKVPSPTPVGRLLHG